MKSPDELFDETLKPSDETPNYATKHKASMWGEGTFPICRSFYVHLSADEPPAQDHKSPKAPDSKGV